MQTVFRATKVGKTRWRPPKPEVRISQLVDHLGIKFQVLTSPKNTRWNIAVPIVRSLCAASMASKLYRTSVMSARWGRHPSNHWKHWKIAVCSHLSGKNCLLMHPTWCYTGVRSGLTCSDNCFHFCYKQILKYKYFRFVGRHLCFSASGYMGQH